jgi:hypothetical protein
MRQSKISQLLHEERADEDQVFKILWPELPGFQRDNVTVVSDVDFTSDQIITKIRWFVVVKEGRESCTCLYVIFWQY